MGGGDWAGYGGNKDRESGLSGVHQFDSNLKSQQAQEARNNDNQSNSASFKGGVPSSVSDPSSSIYQTHVTVPADALKKFRDVVGVSSELSPNQKLQAFNQKYSDDRNGTVLHQTSIPGLRTSSGARVNSDGRPDEGLEDFLAYKMDYTKITPGPSSSQSMPIYISGSDNLLDGRTELGGGLKGLSARVEILSGSGNTVDFTQSNSGNGGMMPVFGGNTVVSHTTDRSTFKMSPNHDKVLSFLDGSSNRMNMAGGDDDVTLVLAKPNRKTKGEMTTVAGGEGQDKVTLQYPVEYEKDRLKLTDKQMAEKYNLNTQGVKDYKIEKTLDQELILTCKNTGHKLFFKNDIEVIEFAKANYMADEPFRAAGKGNNKETYTYRELLKMAKPVGSDPDPVIPDDKDDGKTRGIPILQPSPVVGGDKDDGKTPGIPVDGSQTGIQDQKKQIILLLLQSLLQSNGRGGTQNTEQTLFLFMMMIQRSSLSQVLI